MNKPVAWMSNEYSVCSKKAYENLSQNARSWYPIPLYTHPHPDNLGLAESIIKQQQLKIDNLLENNARLDAEIEILKSHPVKELTDGEIQEISHQYHYTYNPDYVGFAKAILRKAQEK